MINFDFKKNYVLEDNIARLVPLSMDHIQLLLPIAQEPDIWTYAPEKCDNLFRLTEYVSAAIQNKNDDKDYPFAVFDKRTAQIAGTTRFCEINGAIQAMRMGYTWYGKAFRGTGLNKHCKYLMFQFAFEAMNIERIGLAAFRDNHRSIAAMQSVGCIQEGVFRGLFPTADGNGRTDAILFSLLKSDWYGGIKDNLKDKL
ncbi:MAG: GNAT family protein [Bacteroidota bacterium]